MQDETDFDAMFPTSHFEQLLEEGFEFDSYAVTADLLVTRARKGWLSVGDFSSLVFCEHKTLYAHTLQAKQPTTPAMQNGTRIHAILEDEVMPQTVEIAPVSAEDRWALRFCNMIVAVNVFIETGVAREIPIIGRVGPFLVYGIVDQIERRTAAPHHITPPNSSSCVIRDTKTHVMFEHGWFKIFSKLGHLPRVAIAPDPLLVPNVTPRIEYLWQRDHTVVLGVVQEVYDAHWVETVLKRGVEFWQGNVKVKEMLGLDSLTCTEAKDCAKNVVAINLKDACGESDCQVNEATVYDMESLYMCHSCVYNDGCGWLAKQARQTNTIQ
ncbi:hypothetical protein HDU80_010294 [Chytriomyces hyalinus]|nr:hypothetical protein HDU80_010294 [Chytriomyces hyalinus]